MPTINWREVFKFLSGAAFSGSLINFYLSVENVSVPFMGYTIGPRLLGARAAVNFAACVVFFYLGYVRSRMSTSFRPDSSDTYASQRPSREIEGAPSSKGV